MLDEEGPAAGEAFDLYHPRLVATESPDFGSERAL
jgi:hypothetical protein